MQSQINAAAVGDFEFQALERAQNYRRCLVKEFRSHLGGRIIEVGAGVGQMTELLARQPGVREVLAVEPDPRFAPEFRRRLPANPFLAGTVADVPAGSEFESLISVNVLEHIEQDQQELQAYARLLAKRRGTLCLFVPARPEIYAPIDKDFGHFRRYTARGLEDKLRSAGFEILRLHYYNLVGYFAWWFNFCLVKKRQFDLASVRSFDVVFPMLHAIESKVIRPPIGQSLLVFARAVP